MTGEYTVEEMRFLSTPSARRATLRYWRPRRIQQISIHALREEGDERLKFAPQRRLPFLSTPSARRATSPDGSGAGQCAISIHALREEGDVLQAHAPRQDQISIHALREEGDKTVWLRADLHRYFYPRPPRGGRHVSTEVCASYSIFLSTPSARRATG